MLGSTAHPKLPIQTLNCTLMSTRKAYSVTKMNNLNTYHAKSTISFQFPFYFCVCVCVFFLGGGGGVAVSNVVHYYAKFLLDQELCML